MYDGPETDLLCFCFLVLFLLQRSQRCIWLLQREISILCVCLSSMLQVYICSKENQNIIMEQHIDFYSHQSTKSSTTTIIDEGAQRERHKRGIAAVPFKMCFVLFYTPTLNDTHTYTHNPHTHTHTHAHRNTPHSHTPTHTYFR